MDPISAFLVGSAIGGIVGNRADDVFCRVMQIMRERLRLGGKPVNHDLQKAIRKAYLQATLVFIEARLHELGVEPSLLQRDIRHLFHLPPEPSQLLKARSDILHELRQIPDTAYIPPSSEAEQQVELLLQPRGETAQQRVAELKAQLKTQLLQELRRKWRLAPSERLTEMLLHGWQETEQSQTIMLDWFDVLCAFFAEELKQNQRVASIFQSQLLVNLSEQGVSLDYSTFNRQLEHFAGQVLTQLLQAEQTLTQLRQEQVEGFQSLQQRMDEYLPTLLTRTEKVETLLQTLQIEALRRPLYEQYAGLELTQRAEKVIRHHTTLFVGREAELEQLDTLFQQPSGILVITAPAGYGKTTLLANWIDLRHQNGCFIAYHFFRKEYDDANRLDSIPNALYYLLSQLYIYYGVERELPPRDEGQLRDALLGLLRERGARPEEPLVLLLDGLDEAEKPLLLTLPEPLPDGIYVVVSFRAEQNETPDALRPWLGGTAQRLHLQYLPRKAVQDYLARAGDGELALYAQDERFVEKVRQKTAGYPLHLRFLVGDLLQEARAGVDVDAALERTPAGFDAYVRAQLRTLAQSLANAPKVQRMFALIATALGALSAREIETLAELTAFELEAFPPNATRWFSISEQEGERFYAFTHPILGDAFERALGILAQEARQCLLNHCARWGEHKSPYALRHYPAHLREAGDYEALYALARNEAFLQAQRSTLPAEAELPLRTLQIALDAAITEENAPVIAEMLLRHAQLTIQNETPLEALQQGSLERAIGLAKQALQRDYKIGTLWLLLLAWSRHHAGDAASAERCLQETTAWQQGKTLERLKEWQGETAAFLLTPLSYLPDAAAIATRILSDKELKELAVSWAQAGQFARAIETAQQIGWQYHSWAVAGIAQELAQAGQFAQAIETAQQIERVEARSRALAGVAQALTQAGQTHEARALLQQALNDALQIGTPELRSSALVRVAQALVQAGEANTVYTVLQQSLNATRYIDDPESLPWTFAKIAQVVAQVGTADSILWEKLIETTQQIEWLSVRGETLAQIAQALVRVGQFARAIETAQQIEQAEVRSWALAQVAQALAQAGQTHEARTLLQGAMDVALQSEGAANRSRALAQVAQALAQAGQPDVAHTVLQQALDDALQSEGVVHSGALAQVAKALLIMGCLAEAIAIAQQTGWQLASSPVLAEAAQALAQAGQFARAIDIAQQIARVETRLRTMTEIVQAVAQAGQTDEAQDLLQQALDAALQSEGVGNHSQALTEVAKALADRGQFAEAIELVQQIEAERYQTEALVGIVKALAHSGISDRALWYSLTEIVRQSEWAEHRAPALIGIAQALAQTGMTDTARTVLQQALDDAQQIEDAWCRSEASAQVAQALLQMGITDMALWHNIIQTAQQIEDAWYRSQALLGIAQALAQAGKTDEAQDLLQQALDTALQSEEDLARSRASAQGGQNNKAHTLPQPLFKRIQQLGRMWYRPRAVARIAQALAQAGQFAKAIATAQQIKEAQYQSEALVGISRTLVETGITDEVIWYNLIETTLQIEDESYRSRALVEILPAVAQILAQAGEFAEAIEIAQWIGEPRYRSEALVRIAQALVQARRFEEVHALLQQALNAAEQVTYTGHRSQALARVAQVLVQADTTDIKLWRNLIETAQQIRAAGDRQKALVQVAQALMQAEHQTLARSVLQEAWWAAREHGQFSLLWEVAQVSATLGFDDLSVEYAQQIAGEQMTGLPNVLHALSERGAKESFLALLPLCGWAKATALHACAGLIRFYPDQAPAIAEQVMRYR